MATFRAIFLVFALIGATFATRDTSVSAQLGEIFFPSRAISTNPIADLPAKCAEVQEVLNTDWCASQLTCFADGTARNLARNHNVTVQSGPSVSTVSVRVQTAPGVGLLYTATGFNLPISQGGPTTSRGLIFIPEDGVEATAYAPYASAVARTGHYVVVLDNTTGLSMEAIFGRVNIAMLTRSGLRWAIAGHGRGGSMAAQIASVDSRFRGVGLFAADLPDGINFRDSGISVVVVYGLRDEVVTPARVRSYLASRVPFDTWVIAQNVTHMDFTFSTCLGNSLSQGRAGFTELHFLQPELPVFSMPESDSNPSRVVVNPFNPIVQQSAGVVPRIQRQCRSVNTEWYDAPTNTWSSVLDDRTLSDFLYVEATSGDDKILAVIARTNRNGYTDMVAALENKRIRATFECEPFVSAVLGVEFFISSNPATFVFENSAALAGQTSTPFGTNVALNNLMGTLGFRAASQRALSFTNNALLSPPMATNASKVYPAGYFGAVEYYSFENPSTDVNNPIPAKWYIWRPKRGETPAPKGGLVYVAGGAVDPLGYAPLLFEIAARGYVVVAITPILRAATINTQLPLAAILSSQFSDVPANKWAISGHSLGGAGAAAYTWSRYVSPAATTGRPQIVIMHAGAIIPPTNFLTLANSPPLYQVYGTLDDVGTGGFNRYRTSILPFVNQSRTTFAVVDGANHFQTGDYGYQEPDSIATISLERQHTIFAEITVAAMVSVGLA